jgi:hypothetical protein
MSLNKTKEAEEAKSGIKLLSTMVLYLPLAIAHLSSAVYALRRWQERGSTVYISQARSITSQQGDRHKYSKLKPSLSLRYTLYTPTQSQQVIHPSIKTMLSNYAKTKGQTNLQLGDKRRSSHRRGKPRIPDTLLSMMMG